FTEAYGRQDERSRLQNPAFHIHGGEPPVQGIAVPFAMLLNLVSVSNAANKETLWGFISRYAPGVTAASDPELDRLVGYAMRYFEDFVRPAKRFRAPDAVEREALSALDAKLAALPEGADGGAIQDAVLDVARPIERYQDLKKTGPNGGPGVSGEWFQALYQTLIGQERGPRFGSFVALYGVEETRRLIADALAGRLTPAA
ncbi:MAG: lysine--tRNA ligase, partial [Sphingomonas sp.]